MLIALGILLIAFGAILSFAIDASVEGADLAMIGYIVMAAGGVALLAAAIKGAGMMSMSNSRMRSERHVSSDGRHVVEETDVR